jgi:hypothetical protein
MQPPDSQSGQRWNAIRSHVRTYDLLALQTFSLLRETGVYLKVLSDSFRRRFIHVTPNRAYAVCKSFTVRTVTLHPCNELQVKVLHEQQFCSCATLLHPFCGIHKLRLTTIRTQNNDAFVWLTIAHLSNLYKSRYCC